MAAYSDWLIGRMGASGPSCRFPPRAFASSARIFCAAASGGVARSTYGSTRRQMGARTGRMGRSVRLVRARIAHLRVSGRDRCDRPGHLSRSGLRRPDRAPVELSEGWATRGLEGFEGPDVDPVAGSSPPRRPTTSATTVRPIPTRTARSGLSAIHTTTTVRRTPTVQASPSRWALAHAPIPSSGELGELPRWLPTGPSRAAPR